MQKGHGEKMSILTVETPVPTDREIHRKVIDELRWDTIVDETDVGVEVDGGIVTLTGSVKSYAEKIAAQKAAHRVAGVLDVVNNVDVKLPGDWQKSDLDIATEVRKALELDVLVPHREIQTTVANGWITLAGSVATWSQREIAERAIAHLPGVRGVTNTLTVAPSAVEPTTVRTAIEEALARQAEREAENIQVAVSDGTVTLSGKVRSWYERRAVVGAAGHAPGIRNVVDHMRIDPYR